MSDLNVRVIVQVAEPDTDTVWDNVLTLTPPVNPQPFDVEALTAELQTRLNRLARGWRL